MESRSRGVMRRIAAIGSSARGERRSRRGLLAVESLEGRVVLSGSAAAAAMKGLERELVATTRAFTATGGAAPGGAPTQVLNQDAHAVAGAYMTFNSAFLRAASSLRSSGQAGFDSAVASATANLDSAIQSTLMNLPQTGPALSASLKADADALGSALRADAASSGGSGTSLARQGDAAIAATFNRAASAIYADSASSQVSSVALARFDASVNSAVAEFHTSIVAMDKAALSAKKGLAPADVGQALATLQGRILNALPGLGSAFVASPSNPTAAIQADIRKSYDAMTGIAPPKATSAEVPAQFQDDVRSAAWDAEAKPLEDVTSAVQSYNTGLL